MEPYLLIREDQSLLDRYNGEKAKIADTIARCIAPTTPTHPRIRVPIRLVVSTWKDGMEKKENILFTIYFFHQIWLLCSTLYSGMDQ